MECYQVVMETRTEGKGISLVSLDKTEEMKRLAKSLTERNQFLFEGERIYPRHVHNVSLFRTTKPAAELTLPNGRRIADYKKWQCKRVGCCKHRFIARCFEKMKLTEVSNCTKEFIVGGRDNRSKKNPQARAATHEKVNKR